MVSSKYSPVVLATIAICFAGAMRLEAATVVDNRLLSNQEDGTNWASYGRTFDETHYSPLKEINPDSVSRLGLAWSLDLNVTNSITAPLAVNGVIYLAAGYTIVHAVDAKSGKLLWRYDSNATQQAGKKLRSGWGIRGLAFWKDKVYAGTQDGRLLALNAKTGKLVWSVQTVNVNGVFISGPPRVFNDKVLIGNGGADYVPMRGYVTAYDAESGKKVWRFYVVPGKPGQKDGEVSDSAMEMAAKTWTGEWWKYGGGGAVWNAFTYDPELNRVYLGTGNSGPYNEKIRSPQGGDNLFLASIVALDADTGKYIWHYQNTPGDIWDYNSSQDITLATLNIENQPRKVIFHAPKNGFFYVLDRETGKLISAEKLGTVTWAERIDLTTGRPVEAPLARYGEQPVLLYPSYQGTHHWPPQSFNPNTGLVYVPIMELPALFARLDPKYYNPILHSPDFVGLLSGDFDAPPNAGRSVLKAWDPKTQKTVWQVDTSGISNGGTLTTGGNLVFQGLADGYFHAYSADKGADVWKFYAGVAVTGVPITYSVDGKQYVTITSGPLHGASGIFGAMSARWGWDSRVHPRRLLTFVLDGKAKLPPTPPPAHAQPIVAPKFKLDQKRALAGVHDYLRCIVCHGAGVVAGGNAPDLRASPIPLNKESFATVVRGGSLVARGMPQFAELTDDQLENLRHYIRGKARGMSFMPVPPAAPASGGN
jgi:quinohemoprotein ethanol dehydrogenase